MNWPDHAGSLCAWKGGVREREWESGHCGCKGMAPCSEPFWFNGGVNDREIPGEWPLTSGGGIDEEAEAEEIPLRMDLRWLEFPPPRLARSPSHSLSTERNSTSTFCIGCPVVDGLLEAPRAPVLADPLIFSLPFILRLLFVDLGTSDIAGSASGVGAEEGIRKEGAIAGLSSTISLSFLWRNISASARVIQVGIVSSYIGF